ncbi:hypothetical protein OIU78_023098 [Salix suchowensis]|nr:hypothetical protein OIU78_023098 [Salix suchowensis]
MGVEDSWDTVVSPPPTAVVPLNLERDGHWRHFDNSVNAVSFGFVATAILISMFLVMAIFERFLRPRSLSSSAGANGSSSSNDPEAQVVFHGKLDFPSPKNFEMSSWLKEYCVTWDLLIRIYTFQLIALHWTAHAGKSFKFLLIE